MSDQLFGSITLPHELRELVHAHRLHLDQGSGSASVLDGWRALLRHQRSGGPMELFASAHEHLEHFEGHAEAAVDELIGSPWGEVVSLGLALQSLLHFERPVASTVRAGQPRWLTRVEHRRVEKASVRQNSSDSAPTAWVIELDFGLANSSCMNVWINPNGSLYQLYPSDESIEELEAFLVDIDHRDPRLPFIRIPVEEALAAFRLPGGHPDTTYGDRAMLHWLRRSTVPQSPA